MNSIILSTISKKFKFVFLVIFLTFTTIHANQKGDNLWEKRIPISLNGIIQPHESLKIQSSVGGRIIAVNVNENDQVKRDQILLIIKNDNQKQQLKVAELQLRKNQTNLEDSKQQIILSKMKIDTSRNRLIDSERQLNLLEFQILTSSNNVKDRERQLKISETQINISANSVKDQETNLKDIERRLKDEQTLFEQGSSTKSQLDSVQLQRDRALLALANAKLNLLRTKQDLEGSIISLENAKISLKKAEQDYEGGKIALENAKISLKVSEQELKRVKMSSENAEISLKLSEQEVLIRKDALEDTYVKSKISGIVVTKNVEEGEMIGGGSDLFTIINLKKIEVVFEVSESDLPNVELNRPIIFSTPSYPSLYFKAKIQRISWTSNPETGLFPVFALGENKDNLLRIGMSTKIYLLN